MSAMAAAVPMLNVQVDGEWQTFPKGTRLIEACMKSGHFIPHYCYHPKLSSPGNCRMCLVELGMPKMTPERKPVLGADGRPEIAWSPRPAISCATEVSDGMAVRTSSPLVEECRQGVMEFLLINHPLDCPICDQAGECRLQEFSVEHGNGESRFREEKVKKPKNVDIGPRIRLDDERCIMCSRCVRFMRGDRRTIRCWASPSAAATRRSSVHPGKRLENNYSLNTVDICPVGALTANDFRFQHARVVPQGNEEHRCTKCGQGTNILIGSRQDVIYRITPRENDSVNSCWMPDSHRLNFQYVNSEKRLREPVIKGDDLPASWPRAIQTAAEQLRRGAKSTAMIASARMTNEELFLARRLVESLGIELFDVLPRPQKGDGFLVSEDGNPNTMGAKLIGMTTGRLQEIASGVSSGTIKSLIVFGEDAAQCGVDEDDLEKLDSLVVMAILPNKTTEKATLLLPAASWAEKEDP